MTTIRTNHQPMRSMIVEQFKPSGKWYQTLEFITDEEKYYDVIEDIKKAILTDPAMNVTFIYYMSGDTHTGGFPVLLNLQKGCEHV